MFPEFLEEKGKGHICFKTYLVFLLETNSNFKLQYIKNNVTDTPLNK